MSSEKPLPYEEALAEAGQGRFQWVVTFAGAMCLLCSYVAVSTISFVLPSSQCDLELTSQGKGALIASGFVGIILSSHLWGFLSDTLGRRYILTRCLLADGILYICSGLVPNYWIFLVMRLFNGFSSCGGVVSAWAYIGEFHTDRHRTRAIMIASVIGCTIYVWLPCLAWLIIPLPIKFPLFHGIVFKSWRLFYMMCGVPSLLTSLIMMILPESPKFLLAGGRKQECIKVLQYVYSKNTGKRPDDLVVPNVTIGDNERIAKIDPSMSTVSVFFNRMWLQTSPLFKKPLGFNFFILCAMQFILYYCNNGMFLWVPETVNRIAQFRDNNPGEPGTYCQAMENFQIVLSDAAVNTPTEHRNMTDVNSFEFLASRLDEEKTPQCKDSIDFSVYHNSIMLGSFSVLGLVVIIFLMNIFSRKFVLVSFLIGSIFMTLSLIFLNRIELVFCIVTVMCVCTGSAIPVVTSVVVDHFPTNLRAMAVCLTLMSGRLGTIVSSQLVGSTLDTHCNVILYCFTVILALCTLLLLFLPPSSTSGSKPVNRIQEIYRENSTEPRKSNIV